MIRTAAALAVAVALLVGGTAAGAEAASRPTKADRHVMVEANHACTSVPGEVEYEACVVGAFVLARHRYIDERFYSASYEDVAPGVPCTCVTLDRASKKIK